MIDIADTLITSNQNLLKDNALIIFIKNPQLGKVKTRLAVTVGNEKALEIYHILMQHTQAIVDGLVADKYLYYSDFVDERDSWQNEKYYKAIQREGQDLGLKMASAFGDALEKNHKKVVIIGSDCLELNQIIVEKAYEQLADNEVVIGPAVDGGYYLIGFNFDKMANRSSEVLDRIFLNKEWSHEKVCEEAIEVCNQMGLRYFELPTLTDVDEEKDYLNTQHLAQKLS